MSIDSKLYPLPSTHVYELYIIIITSFFIAPHIIIFIIYTHNLNKRFTYYINFFYLIFLTQTKNILAIATQDKDSIG